MDSPLPIEARGRPWRTATLVASGVAAIELVLLVLAGIALLARPLSHHVRSAAVQSAAKARAKPKPSAVRREPVSALTPKLTRRRTTIVVLNGNGVTGAAGSTAAHVRGRGYRVAMVGDASRQDYPTSVVMYRPGFRAEGVRLARDFRVRVVGPLDGIRVRGLKGAQLALVVGH